MTIHNLDCRWAAAWLGENSVDAIVTDPPYELGFMGKSWDASGVAYDIATWRAAYDVLKPGGHLLAFSGSRTYHRMVCAIEDAGFEIRDQIMWVYGSGFPKSLDVSKAIDKAAGAERKKERCGGLGSANSFADDAWTQANAGWRIVDTPITDAARQWRGWGTALKPAHEPIVVARKPLVGTVAANVLQHGTGALNIDGCRIAGEPWKAHSATGLGAVKFFTEGDAAVIDKAPHDLGRWPANLIHDGSDDVLAAFPQDAGRFFYCAKASKSDRGEGNVHPTVKPTDLMRYLCRLVTPPGGTVLDLFAGSGSTGVAAKLEGLQFVGFELEPAYIEIALRRIERAKP